MSIKLIGKYIFLLGLISVLIICIIWLLSPSSSGYNYTLTSIDARASIMPLEVVPEVSHTHLPVPLETLPSASGEARIARVEERYAEQQLNQNNNLTRLDMLVEDILQNP